MLINEVETKVGLSKKSIRLYEANGLLTPNRDNINSYRLYSDEDIRKLKTIKFMRELNVSINDLKLLNNGKLTLNECLEERIKKIDAEEKNYHKVKEMCKELLKKDLNFNTLDISEYLEEMNVMNKRGFTMKKDIYNHKKKIVGACLSSLIVGGFYLTVFIIFLVMQITSEEKIGTVWFLLIEAFFGLPLIAIISNLTLRIKEIKSCEEDIASKY